MLTRQKLWVPVTQHNPAFREYLGRFLTNNPITCLSMAALNLQPENMFVALEPDGRDPSRQVAAKLAIRCTVRRAACDTNALHETRRNGSGEEVASMSYGFATALVDSANSIHVMERLLPLFVPHVSVNIQSQLCAADPDALAEGTDLVVISSIDKLGKRLVYCQTDFYREEARVSAEVAEAEAKLATLAELNGALRRYRRLLHGTHVKSILLPDKNKAAK